MALNSESITWQTGDLRRVSRFLALASVSSAKQGNWTESSHFLNIPMCERADHRADQAERKDPLSSEWPVLCPPDGKIITCGFIITTTFLYTHKRSLN